MAALSVALQQIKPYPIPLAWLASVHTPSALDALEILLLHSYDGEVIFETDAEERWPQSDDPERRLRAFFGRPNYSKNKNALIACGLLRPFGAEDRLIGKTEKARRELSQGIKYRWAEWPLAARSIHRPRPYLRERWPVWLGDRDLGSRMVLLAMLTPNLAARLCDPVSPPEIVKRSREEILAYVESCFAHLDDAAFRRSKVDKGIDELSLLGLLHEEPDGTFVLRLADLEQRPTWPPSLIAKTCGMQAPTLSPLATLLGTLMDACCEPVTSLRPTANALQKDFQGYLFVAHERRALLKHAHSSRRPGHWPRAREVIEAHKTRLDVHARRMLSGEFVLPVRTVAAISETTDAELLVMPVKSVHGVNATQLLVQPVFGDEITVERVREVLADMHLMIWQIGRDGQPAIKLLPNAMPSTLDVAFGYVVRANDLHRWLDYRRPFEVILKSRHVEPHLTLRCVFRVLMSK
jgi:hypothetical protein